MTTTINTEQVANFFAATEERIQEATITVLGEVAEEIAETARQLILSGTKSGRIYGFHQASAPGEPPASNTGQLVASITVQKSADELTAIVRADSTYATALEFGTTQIAPRPFLQPALEQNRNKTRKAFVDEINKVLK